MAKPLIRDLRLIGEWKDLAKYYVDDNTGNVWSYNACTGSMSNCGSEAEFRARFYSIYRGKLFETVSAS